MFTSNYPFFQSGQSAILATPQRVGALPQYSGRGVVMAFVDAGFYPHPDLDGRVLLHVDASSNHVVEQAPDAYEPSDLSWHGQMTSVIAAGDGRSSGGKYRGIAWGASLVLIKVSTPRGHVKEADILRGLRWLIDTRQRVGVRVVNISVGGDFVSDDPEHPLHQAVRRLVESGVTVITAAGNRQAPSVVPPASAPEAITIGGLNDHNSLDESLWTPYHSNYGFAWDGSSKPDLIAPAEWVAGPIMPETIVAREARWLGPLLLAGSSGQRKRLLKQGYSDLGISRAAAWKPDDHVFAMIQARINSHKIIDAHHQHVDGTSVAAPIVSAVAAQMLEANPGLTPGEIRSILMATARPLANTPLERQGAGVLRAAAAVERALSFQP